MYQEKNPKMYQENQNPAISVEQTRNSKSAREDLYTQSKRTMSKGVFRYLMMTAAADWWCGSSAISRVSLASSGFLLSRNRGVRRVKRMEVFMTGLKSKGQNGGFRISHPPNLGGGGGKTHPAPSSKPPIPNPPNPLNTNTQTWRHRNRGGKTISQTP